MDPTHIETEKQQLLSSEKISKTAEFQQNQDVPDHPRAVQTRFQIGLRVVSKIKTIISYHTL